MATINIGNASPTEDIRQYDIKHAAIHIQPVTLDTPTLTPAATPEDASPAEETMAGKKIYSMERPDDRARQLAAKLTLEEQQQHSDLDYVCGRKPSEIGFRRLTFRINGFFYSLKTPPDLVNLFQKPKQPRD
ncbi:glycoside hydrolase family 3 protein [Alternaria alternata]|nr:glycoside hydrolase family 3 protein [Alternaria alternata]